MTELARLASVLALVAAAGCGRLGFSERPVLDAGLDAELDSSTFVAACPGPSLECEGGLPCHDFESGNFDDWSYECDGDDFECSPTIPEVALEIVETPACNGQRVYRAFTEGGLDTRQNAYLGQFVDEDVVDDMFVRFAMRWPSNSNVLGRGIVLIPLLPSDQSGSPRFGFGRTPGDMRVRLLDTDYVFAAPTIADQWTCIELHLTASSAEVWVDGASVFERDGESIPADARFGAVTLGITASSDDGGTELFFDDFAVSKNRIGCVPARP